ncbi:hypothetical protein D9O50_09675 [Oxalobacteraceae bacterium CAVE-383]|nr:hypothetical protein D9O50_09675 [Oxalobacteraceae bacterium CAVE-383]
MKALAARLFYVLFGWFALMAVAAAQQPPSVAFYYGDHPPLADLQAFDIAVVEPDYVADPQKHTRAAKDGAHELFAYVSLGEIQPSRPYYKELPEGSLRNGNAAWGGRVIDQTAPGWKEFFLSRIVDPLWRQGWRGFFLDTLDSYQLFAKTDAERAAQTAAMVDIVREFKRRYPDAKLMLNRGFELLPEIAPLTYAVAAESLYQGYDAGRKTYGAVSESNRDWLLGQMTTARDRYHLPVIAIDYVDPARPKARDLARETAKKIRAQGFVPWVADGGLASIGVGSVELVPRNVLVLLEVAKGEDLHTIEMQRFLGIHLNHLGLRYEFVDLGKQPLPDMVMAGRYAGVVTWFREGADYPKLAPWLKKRIDEGVPIAIFDRLGFQLTPAAASMLGVAVFDPPAPQRLSIESSDADMMGFEMPPRPDIAQLQNMRLRDTRAKSLLRLKDNRGNVYDAAALTPWGGFVLAPFGAVQLPSEDANARWVVQPLKFLKAALGLPDFPVPDVTTEGGRRILMSHLDGDGFPSRAEYPGSPFAVEVLQREIWDRYKLPITVSVVEGELSPKGVYPALSHLTEPLARRMYQLPYIEGASHSFSHPFSWSDAMNGTHTADPSKDSGEAAPALDVPNYKFDLQREIKGSMDYINDTLMPAGKKAEIFFWTGNCVPPPAAIAQVYKDGYLNMNGGDTTITESGKSWTRIAAQGVRKDGWYQVFAPDQDENIYTNGWSGPYYGFQRVIETFKLTGEPVRFKAVDIYYHFYAGTKPASIAALHKIHRWALAQPFTHLYASQYIRKVIDFENTSVARDLDGGDLIVRTGANLRTLRLIQGAPAPSLTDSRGLAGISPGPEGQYLTTAASEVRLVYKAEAAGTPAGIPTGIPIPAAPSIYEASGMVGDFSRTANGGKTELRFTLSANGPATFSIGGARQCSASADGKALRRTADRKNSISALPYAGNAGNAAIKSDVDAVLQYEIGTSPTNFATTRHMVFVQCAA